MPENSPTSDFFLLPYKKSCPFFLLPIKLNDTLKSDLSSLG